jgi:hypothetical protein
MTPSERLPGRAQPSPATLTEAQVAATPYRAPVYIACTVLALVTNYVLGKEMAWDLLNYHLYAGFSAVHDRFSQDYFAAGPQSYMNPFVYAPFYGLVRSGIPALAIGSVLAALHSVILWLTYELAASVCPSDDRRTRLLFGVCAVGLAFVNPILMQQLGSSFADIMTAELVLAGWVLLAGAVREPSTIRIVCAGILLGAATALKLTNAVHAIAAIAVLIMLPMSVRERLRYGFLYTTVVGLGFVIVTAPWSYHLAKMFGNPMFPLLNGVFRSPEFTTEPLRHFRFIPDSFAEALWRPFAMVDPVNMVHEELRAPDPRYAVLVVLVSALFLRWLWRCLRQPQNPSTGGESPVTVRTLAALGCGLAADWFIWLSGSGNSRYFLPMASVASVVVIALLFRLFAARPKIRNYILIAVFATQIVQLWMGTEFRWNAAPWDAAWFDVTVPDKLANEPSLYLTMGTQSNSFIAPFLARGAGLVNVSGGYTLGSDGANGARIKALINRYTPHLRVLLRGAQLYGDDERRDPRRSQVDDSLARFGLRVDMTDCATITVRGLPPELEITLESSVPVPPAPRDTTYLVSCHVVPDNSDRSAQVARQHLVDLVLDRLEDACPNLFQPRRPGTEHGGRAWVRRYMNTDLTAWVSNGEVKFVQPIRGAQLVYVGRESDWANAPLRLACGRRDNLYFAKVLKRDGGP